MLSRCSQPWRGATARRDGCPRPETPRGTETPKIDRLMMTRARRRRGEKFARSGASTSMTVSAVRARDPPALPWFLELSAETNVEPLEKRTKRRFDRHSRAPPHALRQPISEPLHHVRPLLRSAHRRPRRPRRAPSRRPRRATTPPPFAFAPRLRSPAEAATTKGGRRGRLRRRGVGRKAEAPAAPPPSTPPSTPPTAPSRRLPRSATTCPCSTTPWWPSRSPAPSRSSTAAPP